MSSYIQATPRGGALNHGPLFAMPSPLKEGVGYRYAFVGLLVPKSLCPSNA